jgi:hypothetical protein
MKSTIAPKGQKNPQKTLPKTAVIAVMISTTIAKPGTIEREAMTVRNPFKGFMRRSHLVSMLYASGKLRATKKEIKKIRKKND